MRNPESTVEGRVLVVDDDAGVRGLVRAVLRSDGMQVDEAHDGAAAVEKLSRAAYDCIVLDLMMPNHDGLELLQQIEVARPAVKRVVVITASSEAVISRVPVAIVETKLRKPFDIMDLRAAVARCVSHSHGAETRSH
ncbi:MAG TPA: response regulator [Thermoanaerobaculia bacterium]|nr:response regulator [Thermoanaerobaculia bacterium]